MLAYSPTYGSKQAGHNAASMRKVRRSQHRTNEEHPHGVGMHSQHQNLVVDDCGQLRVSKGEGPETEVGGSVGNTAKHKLDGVDGLVHKDLSKLKLLAIMAMTSFTSSSSIISVSIAAGVLPTNTRVTCLLQKRQKLKAKQCTTNAQSLTIHRCE